MTKPLLPLIDISKEGLLNDYYFPVLPSVKLFISIKSFDKYLSDRIMYDSNGEGFKISGYELISSSFLKKRKEISLVFTEVNESIDLDRLKQLGIKNSSRLDFLEDEELEIFKEKIYSMQNFRELIIHLSEYKAESFECTD